MLAIRKMYWSSDIKLLLIYILTLRKLGKMNFVLLITVSFYSGGQFHSDKRCLSFYQIMTQLVLAFFFFFFCLNKDKWGKKKHSEKLKRSEAVYNAIFVIIKQYIYASTCRNKIWNINEVFNIINYGIQVEKYIATKNDKHIFHNNKWALLNI